VKKEISEMTYHRFGLFDRVFRFLLLISPREHLLHHASTIKGNYGNFTAIWDRLFGTYISPNDAGECTLGLDYDQDFLGAITAGQMKLSQAGARPLSGGPGVPARSRTRWPW
jgi:sterol desaturase/sphingolipid hydroxylase (fatty acid hydroxylase superfamily)